jgi:hypothetical protein
MNPVFLAVFQRHRYLDKKPVPAQDRHRLKPTYQYRHKKGFIKTFIIPEWAGLLVVNDSLVPYEALCPGAGDAERPQEILYFKLININNLH